MKVVPSVPFGVRGCSVLHGRTADPEGFVALPACRGCGMTQYASAEAVKVMGNEFGMVPKDQAISNRFEINQLEKENAELTQTIRDQELLEAELVEARETISRADEALAIFERLAEEGYTAHKVSGLLRRIASWEENFAELKETLAEVDSTLREVDDLAKNGKRKVPA